jgi:hypothetical protein|tara:strand:- start:726 stop:920 length:195 start_codon:yes stop_codon:yes gene_type:complete
MEEMQYFIPATKVNYKVIDFILEGYDINIGGYTYRRVSKRMKGRQILHRLTSTQNENIKMVVYK